MTLQSKFSVDLTWKLVLADLGIKPIDALRKAGLPDDCLSREDVHLTTAEYYNLWMAVDDLSGVENLPLALGQMAIGEVFHPLIFACLCSKNFLLALSRLSHYKRLVGPMTLDVEDKLAEITVSFSDFDIELPLPPKLIATELVFITNLGRTGTRKHLIPKRVEAKYPLLPEADYENYFGTKVEISDINRLTFSKEDAQAPFLTENKEMWSFFEPELQRKLVNLDNKATFTERSYLALLELLPGGFSTAEDLARRLGVSRRTLQRNLLSEKTSYQEILSKTREKLAHYYLKKSDLPISRISFLLGFDDPTSFFRAFRSWTGSTPGALRER
ncbi:AraC family transcriptional regulator ligand-binding domain-containing protein [Leptospira sp. SA-E8]|uniref:AraC family transcriptional regulator n=1 Tax=Leptospira sp. SA-E8 TaxID=3422259 RepID=UPI003EBDC38F